ncbi:MAG: DNA polymerase Y family protein [Acidobacteria bacterium]|nr:DNA polymerase Y family protein [Acidobacteriota bacterium]
MKRYLSVWFPEWPLDRLRRARRNGKPLSARPVKLRPFVLHETSAHGLTVAAANAAAKAAGIGPGMRFSDARASVPHLAAEEIDREEDARALRLLARWATCFSPLVALDGEDGLLLETTGCDHLFGGEQAMAGALSERLARAGYLHRIAMAGTPGAAHALAHFGTGQGVVDVVPEGGERDGIGDLPTQALRLSPEAATLLRRFGLTRISQLYGIDRKALARRFQSRAAADAVCLRLDQALGIRREPIVPLRPPAEHVCRLPCPEPLTQPAGIEAGLQQLTEALCAELSGKGVGARRFVFSAFHTDGQVSEVSAQAARPVRAPEHVLRLFREKLARIDPGFGIDLLLLEARRTDAMEMGSRPLSGELAASRIDEVALAAMSDRINARLGDGAVTLVVAEARHAPDAAERQAVFTGEIPGPAVLPARLAGLRPVRMLGWPERVDVIAQVPDGPPLSFIWRRVMRRVVRSDGPERIAPEWWLFLPGKDAAPGKLPRTRDYYRIEDADGRRYWVFREGLYDDGRGQMPEWFVQGLFA